MQKKLYKINLLLEIFSLFLIFFFLGKILSLDILPSKYYISILLLVILMLIIFLLLNKIKNNSLKILQLIILLLINILLLYSNHSFGSILNFLNSITAKKYQIEEYYVIVRHDSSYQTIEDINHQTIAIYPSTTTHYQKVLDELKNTIDLFITSYHTPQESYDALLNKEVESMLISFLEKQILEQELDFSKVRILTKEQEKVETIPATETTSQEESFNVFISGMDLYGDISLISRSDVNMIATINTTTHKILLTSIPRDYYVRLPEKTGYKDKLTHAGLYGINTSIGTLENLLGIEIAYYIRINFTTVVNLVDQIGGVDVYVDKNFTAWTNRQCTYQVGTMHLDGKCALAYARERYAYEGGDRHRIQNQQDILKAILNKGLTSTTLITNYSSILNTLESNLETNIPNQKIYQMIHLQLDTMPTWTIEKIRLNGTDSSNYTYSYPSQKLYVMEPDQSTITYATQKIKETLTASN